MFTHFYIKKYFLSGRYLIADAISMKSSSSSYSNRIFSDVNGLIPYDVTERSTRKIFTCTICKRCSHAWRNLWDKWVREPDDRSHQSSEFHTFKRYTCTVVTRINSAVTDYVGLYIMRHVNLNMLVACIRVHKVWVTRKCISRDKGIPHVCLAFTVKKI